MTGPEPNTPPPTRTWALLLSVLLPLLALAGLGQDGNWDLRNYHLYDPHAWLHRRLLLDIAPAQIQSWHNPLLDVPLYLMSQAGVHGALIGAWLTLPLMLALYFLLRLHPLLVDGQASRSASLALALMATTGAAAYSTLGTSFNDAFVAAGVLGALFLLLRAPVAAQGGRDWLLAGVLAGATAGLKLTAGGYCLGLAAAVLLSPPLRQSPRRLSALALGGALGFALTYGYWGWLQYRLHGNPFFPYYNNLFHSPDALPLSNADVRFRPQSLPDALAIPFRLLANTKLYSEVRLHDPRLLLGMASFVALCLRQRRPAVNAGPVRRRQLTVFFFASFALWALQYGIYRYALPLELLACLGLVLLLEKTPPSQRMLICLLASLLVIAGTKHPHGERMPFGGPLAQVRMPALPAHSLLVLSSQMPLGYAATAVPDDVPMISIYNNFMRPDRCTALQAHAEQRIAAHAGPLWLLRSADPADDEGARIAQRYYGLTPVGACRPVPTGFGELRLCPLRREPRPTLCPATPGR